MYHWRTPNQQFVEYNGYRYNPVYDHDNDRAWYWHIVEVKHPTEDIWVEVGTIDVSCSPTFITQEVLMMWIEAGMPCRKIKDGIGPMTIEQIKDAYDNKINEILLGVE